MLAERRYNDEGLKKSVETECRDSQRAHGMCHSRWHITPGRKSFRKAHDLDDIDSHHGHLFLEPSDLRYQSSVSLTKDISAVRLMQERDFSDDETHTYFFFPKLTS